MNPDLVKTLLDLFDQCQSRGQCLEINLDKDLLPIFPLPRKLTLDLLTDQSTSPFFALSDDQNTVYMKNNFYLCSIDQNHAGSCNSSSCEQLHICRDYILNKNCLQFKSNGKCSHSHSLDTNHNQAILDKFHLSSQDEQTFELISRSVRISSSNQPKVIVQSMNGQIISDKLIDQWLDQHKPLLVSKTFLNPTTVEFLFDDDEVASMMENYIIQQHPTTTLVKKNGASDILSSNYDQDQHFNKPLENRQISTFKNDRQDKDLDREVELTNKQPSTTFDGSFGNQSKRTDINPILNTSPGENRISINFGRGRGRLTSSTAATAPSFSKKNTSPSLNNQSSRNSMTMFSQRLSSNLPSPNDQLSSMGTISTNEKKFSFSQRLNPTTNEHSSHQTKTKSTDTSSSSTPEMATINTNHISDRSTTLSSIRSLPAAEQNNQNESHYNSYSQANDATIPLHSPPLASSTCQDGNNKLRYVLRGNQTKTKEKSPTSTTRTLTPYIYNKQFSDEHLCYLLGPGRQRIIENDQCQIISYLPSGYCRLTDINQGKQIEKQLYSILPESLNINIVKINDELALLASSSAAENIFQQSQLDYAIISEPSKLQLNIEVIDAPVIERRRSVSTSSKNTASSRVEQEDSDQFSSDGKFHIRATGSSIEAISGDISQIPVDLMICVSTSNNLRDSVLRRAGPKIEFQYKERYRSTDAILLDGGSTSARKILFVPWQTEIEEAETTKTQKSLSDLVKWCIDQAHGRNMKSVSFPPIGTGQLGLDPVFVCEAMISAASESLHKYQMDVLFVIYQSNRTNNNDDDECYQVFRMYLDSLAQQIKPKNISSSPIENNRKTSNTFDTKKRYINKNVQGKRLLTLSDCSNMVEHHNLLIKSLKELIYEKTFDLSLIDSSFIDQVNLLIDICLEYQVIPCIDLSKGELTLRGDYDSCSQCFFNLRKEKKIHQYSYVFTQNGQKSDENSMNRYISLKIDEAFATGQSNIRLKDGDQMSLNIDLNRLQVQINDNRQSAYLIKKQLNADSKIVIPTSWSSSLLTIGRVEMRSSSMRSLKCFQAFEETMSKSDWQIERIDSIENSPLYIHFMSKKKEESKLYFHGCSYSSVQSIIHYGLHSNNNSQHEESICLTRNVIDSHFHGSRRSTDGKYYLFAVELAKTDNNNNHLIFLSNNDIHLTLPTYLIVYQRRKNSH